jgi:acyl-CoA thioesterase-1
MMRFLFLLVLLPFAAAQAADKTVLVFGDSLSAGFGIGIEQSWPSLLAKRLESEKPSYTLTNASISGETTAGGRSRLNSAIDRFKPAIVVLALGANDGLRGLPPVQMRENLAAMVRTAREHRARVLLVGMKLPPNYGPAYSDQFEAAFRDIARQEKVALLPFLLEPIALDAAAYQADRLHPTAAAQPKIVDHVWAALKPLLKQP